MPYRPRSRSVARPLGLTAVTVLLAALLTTIGVAAASAEGTGSISGTVTNTRGEPLPNSRVRAFIPDGTHILKVVASATTDEAGRYTLSGLTARDYGIHAYGPDGTEYLGEVWDDQDSYRTPTVISLAEGESREGIDLQLAIAGIVTGVVTDTDGIPLPGASVRFQLKNPPPGDPGTDRSVTTDESGAYEIRRLDPGSYGVSFWFSSSSSFSATGYVPVTNVAVEVRGDAVVELDMSLTKASGITGSVTDSRGEDVGSIMAILYELRDGRWLEVAAKWYGTGRYGFGSLPAGTYAVMVYTTGDDNYVAQWWGGRHAYWGGEDPNAVSPDEIELGTGVSFTADVVLDSGAWVRGTVLDEDGEPIRSKHIRIHLERDGEWEPFLSVYSSPNGIFEFTRLPAGTYTLEFPDSASVVGEWWTDAAVPAGARRIQISEGAVVSGIDATLARRPVSLSVPLVTGSTQVGSTLAVSATSSTPGATFAYEWYADGSSLAGQADASLVLAPEHAGRSITVRVTASAPGYAPASSESAPTAPVSAGTLPAGSPSITGTAATGSTLVADPGIWPGDTTFTYRWFADGAAIVGATTPSLKPSLLEVGATISVEVTGSRAGYTSTSAVSAATAPVVLRLLSAPTDTTRPADPVPAPG